MVLTEVTCPKTSIFDDPVSKIVIWYFLFGLSLLKHFMVESFFQKLGR